MHEQCMMTGLRRFLLALSLGHLTESVAVLPADKVKVPHSASSSGLPPASLLRPSELTDLGSWISTWSTDFLLNMEGDLATPAAQGVGLVPPFSKGAGSLDPGYVMLVVAGSVLVNLWQMMMVGRARKRFNVLYPKMYSEDKEHFNCYQRAHQNYLENIPLFIALLLLSSVYSAKCSAGLGAVWLTARVIYALGYNTGEPKNRMYGFLMSKLLCELPMLVMTILAGGNLAKLW